MKLIIKAKSDDMEIIASGLGFTFGEKSNFELYLNFDEIFKFILRLQFEEDISTYKAHLKSTTDFDNGIITITCVNCDDFIGTGTLEPLEIATYNDRKIYFKFWVRTPKEKTTREIRYCFYIEKGKLDD